MDKYKKILFVLTQVIFIFSSNNSLEQAKARREQAERLRGQVEATKAVVVDQLLQFAQRGGRVDSLAAAVSGGYQTASVAQLATATAAQNSLTRNNQDPQSTTHTTHHAQSDMSIPNRGSGVQAGSEAFRPSRAISKAPRVIDTTPLGNVLYDNRRRLAKEKGSCLSCLRRKKIK